MLLLEILNSTCRANEIVATADLIYIIFDLLISYQRGILHVGPIQIAFRTQELSVFSKNAADLMDMGLNTLNDPELLLKFRFGEKVEGVNWVVTTTVPVNTTNTLDRTQRVPV